MKRPIVAMEGLLFGCDPEVFIRNDKGILVCADGLIPGTKEEPHKVEGGAVQVDGMAAEINIDPVDNFKAFNDNINKVLGQLKAMLPAGYTLDFSPSVEFTEEVWNSAPDHAKELGCNPDFNAWTGTTNSPPDGDALPRVRTGAGHLHIGWTKDADMSDLNYIEAATDLVKQLDWYLGGWSVLVDKDARRRSLYGKSGAMRFKPYGAEYRVLSNFWLENVDLRLAVWNRLQRGINDMRSQFLPQKNSRHYQFDVCNIRLREMIDKSERDKNLMYDRNYPIVDIRK